MSELETFKTSINLVDFAYHHGFTEIDRLKSSRACSILRRGDDKIGISRDCNSNHWIYFDIRNNTGGTVIDFLQKETGFNLGLIRKELRNWANISNNIETNFSNNYRKPLVSEPDRLNVLVEFKECKLVEKKHTFLESRNLTPSTYLSSRFSNSLYSDRYNNIVFPHYDTEGLCGLEKRNMKFWGFSDLGKKGLWFSRSTPNDKRFVFGESGIDTLSYFQLKDDGITRYYSFCGNLSDDIQIPLLKILVKSNPNIDFVLAFDNDQGGHKMANKIQKNIPEKDFMLDLPTKSDSDWNDMLQN